MYIGQTFEDSYPAEAAEWCNANNAKIIETTTGSTRTFEIVSAEPTVAEKKEIKRIERDYLVNDIQWRVERYEGQVKLGITPNDSEEEYMSILRYVQYLRDIPQDPEFPNIEIKSYEEWK